MKRILLLAIPLLLLGCASECAPLEDPVEPRAVLQQIANALPRASFGWGEAPGLVEMAASTRAEGERPKPQPLKATEDGFRVIVNVYRPRAIWIPYEAVKSTHYSWRPFPNALVAPLLILPWQVVRTTLVLDRKAIGGFDEAIARDTERLEAVSRETGLGGPWSHAQGVKNKILDDEDAHGAGSITLHFEYSEPVPAWFPIGGRAEELGSAFAWIAAHPDVVLEPKPEEAEKDPESPDPEGSEETKDPNHLPPAADEGE